MCQTLIYSYFITLVNDHKNPKVGTIIIFILLLSVGHIARKWQNRDSKPGVSDSKARVISFYVPGCSRPEVQNLLESLLEH